MKKNGWLVLLALACMMTGCQKTGTSIESAAETQAAPESNAEVSAATETATVEETKVTEEEAPTELTFECDGVLFYLPEGYADAEAIDYISYGKELSDSETAYVDIKFDIYGEHPENMTCEDVLPVFMNENLVWCMRNHFDVVSGNFEIDTDSKEEVDGILDCAMLKVTGVIATGDDADDIFYAAYLGAPSLAMYDGRQIPICWIAYGSAESEAVRQEAVAAVDEIAAKVSFTE